MITEDYVSFEIAKLLKEKGFDETVRCFYDIQTEILCDNCVKTKNSYTESIAAPTLQTAMKWLREVHSQIIVPSIRVEDPISGIINCYIVGIWYIPKNNGGAFCYTSPTPYNGYSSFEQACEAAIKYCLENLF